MNFLLAHWHCILPAIGIITAMFLMRDKNTDQHENYGESDKKSIAPEDYQE